MNLSVRFRVNRPKVINETIDGEAVMIDFDSGNYYSLNRPGADILGLIESRATLGQIIEGVSYRYKGSPEDIEEAVSRLVAELQRETLIVPDTEGQLENNPGPEARVETITEADRLNFEAPVLERFTDMQDLLLLDPIHETDEAGWPSVKADTPDEDG